MSSVRQAPGVRDVGIGGLRVRVICEHDAFWPFADRRYGSFYLPPDDAAATPDETIEVHATPTAEIPDEDSVTDAAIVTEDADGLRILRGNTVATWDRAGRRCVLREPQANYRQGEYGEACCDSALRILLSFRLLETDGFLLHSAGLVKDGKGYLFLGESGAGKSTVSRISAPFASVLSDDLALARLTDDGAVVQGTPFYGEFGTAGADLTAPLHGLFFLRQHGANERVPLTPSEALPRFMRSILFFGEDRAATQTVLDLALGFCRRVPCYELRFLPDPSFWSAVEA